MTLYGLLQIAGADPFPFEGRYSGIFSTVGNPNFAAGYLGATLPLVLWPALAPRRALGVRLLAVGLAAAQLVALLATNSSQGFFSAGAGLGVLGWRPGSSRITSIAVTGSSRTVAWAPAWPRSTKRSSARRTI